MMERRIMKIRRKERPGAQNYTKISKSRDLVWTLKRLTLKFAGHFVRGKVDRYR